MISCSLCDFQAFSKGNLSFHLNNVHFKDKEFMCRLCHFKTAYKGALTRHVNSVHLRTGKTKECPICGYVTASLLNLNSHLSVSHHLEIATAFARPSNHNNNSPTRPTGSNHEDANPDDPAPGPPPVPAAAARHPASLVASPPGGGAECRICPFRARDQSELLVHYNLAHLNPGGAAHLPGRVSPGPVPPSLPPIGDEEAQSRPPIHPDDLLELRRRQHEELARRQEILERIEHSRRHLTRHEELVAQINSARILHHQQLQQQQQQHHHHQQQLQRRSPSRSPPLYQQQQQQQLIRRRTPSRTPPLQQQQQAAMSAAGQFQRRRSRSRSRTPPSYQPASRSPPTVYHHKSLEARSRLPPGPEGVHRVEPHSPPPHRPVSPVGSGHRGGGGPVFDEDRANALQCRLCPFQASSFIYLKNHIRTAHLQEVHTLACPLCEYTSDTRSDLENHIDDDHAAAVLNRQGNSGSDGRDAREPVTG